MKVEQLMTRDVETCTLDADLAKAAEIMWRRDCGIVPVLDRPHGRCVGVITDRDICIATATTHRPPGWTPVGDVMTKNLFTCSPDDNLRVAMHRMSEGQVRRLPVVDSEGRLKGILSLNDLALAAERGERKGEIGYTDVVGVLKAVSAHRLPAVVGTGA